MKQSTKRLLVALIAGILACAMLIACSSKPAETEKPAEGDTSDLVNQFIEDADQPKETTTIEYDANGKAVAGTYVFDDYKADMDFSILWNLVLNEDGSYQLSEDNPFIGVQEYAGQSYETDGNRVNCGAMDADKATKEGDWAYPTGFSVLVDVETMTFRPESISDEVFGREEGEDGQPAGGPGGPQASAEQVFTYDDVKEDMNVTFVWTLTIKEDGSFTLTEDNPFIGLKEYAGKEAKIEGNQIICGPMDPAPDQGDWAFPDGFTVEIDGEGTFKPVTFERFGEGGPGAGGPNGGPNG